MNKGRFRKQPIVIEAIRVQKECVINTLEGQMKVFKGDWIITGIKGEQYPCKNDIFRKTYEPINFDAHKLWNTI